MDILSQNDDSEEWLIQNMPFFGETAVTSPSGRRSKDTNSIDFLRPSEPIKSAMTFQAAHESDIKQAPTSNPTGKLISKLYTVKPA